MIQSFIITGFLGVGKTTMLTNTVKQYFKDKKVAIVVNEFGDIGIDGNVLSNVHSEVLEISEGCICCQLSEEFESGVLEIIAKYSPEIIFVETSGASEPFPIFLSMQNLGISVEGVICVIDSKNLNSYKENSTAKYQIGGSNIMVLNKTDLVTPDELEAVKSEVTQIKDEFNIKNTMTGKTIFIFDDAILSGQTVVEVAKLLKNSGAKEVHFLATHGVFTGDALELLEESMVDTVTVTNSIEREEQHQKITVIDI